LSAIMLVPSRAGPPSVVRGGADPSSGYYNCGTVNTTSRWR
jgi:hypothetical protein